MRREIKNPHNGTVRVVGRDYNWLSVVLLDDRGQSIMRRTFDAKDNLKIDNISESMAAIEQRIIEELTE